MSHPKLTLSKAIEGYFLAKKLTFTEQTVLNYRWALGRFTAYWGQRDPILSEIQVPQVRAFLDSLQGTLSQKSLLNIHAVLSSLWTWAKAEGFVEQNIIHSIEAPEPEDRAIIPYSQADVRTMLKACGASRVYQRPGQVECSNSRPTAARDRAMILLLLDGGIRVTELCRLQVGDLDLNNSRVKVFGKRSKERLVPIGRRCNRVLWRYLATREDARATDPLFLADGSVIHPLNRWAVYKLIRRIGARAGVTPRAHPHRFRHTFAISFLRNGGDVYSLQAILGHTSLKMVQRYLMLAQTDTENAHRRASPVDNWDL